MQQDIIFPSGTVSYYFQRSVKDLLQLYAREHAVFVTEEHIAALYPYIFNERNVLLLPSGESSKSIENIAMLAERLLGMEATRKTMLIGVGGGMITDITGFLASVYMRGVRFGFVPTSLLAMVDAAIGGKNGVNLGLHKNILGSIRQPEFILYDTPLLQTLPEEEWSNGFAEIIKYACLFDTALYDELSANTLSYYMNDVAALNDVVMRCVWWKNKVVTEDEQEKSIRKLLNFGHTMAHAIENLYTLPHGKAVAIGMVVAVTISEDMGCIEHGISLKLKELLQRYKLPTDIRIDTGSVMEILKMDKKRSGDAIDYILLTKIGSPVIQTIPLKVIEKALSAYESNH
jgi:3-dehydroquinate synthase